MTTPTHVLLIMARNCHQAARLRGAWAESIVAFEIEYLRLHLRQQRIQFLDDGILVGVAFFVLACIRPSKKRPRPYGRGSLKGDHYYRLSLGDLKFQHTSSHICWTLALHLVMLRGSFSKSRGYGWTSSGFASMIGYKITQ